MYETHYREEEKEFNLLFDINSVTYILSAFYKIVQLFLFISIDAH